VAEPIQLRRLLNVRLLRTLHFPDKIRKTGRKRDAVLTHHFRQRNRRISAPSVTELERVQQERPDEVNAALIGFLKNQ
jgi:hypothetical protein